VWLLWVQYFCVSFPWYFYITFLPKYLIESRHLTEEQASNYAVLPLLFGGFGSIAAGFLAKRINTAMGSVKAGRRLLSIGGLACACLLWIGVTKIEGTLTAMIVMSLASFANDLNMPGAWGSCMDIGRKYAGTVSGSMNMMGNLAGFAAPVVGGYILKNYDKNYNLFMYVMAAMYVIGAAVWPFIDPETPIEQDR